MKLAIILRYNKNFLFTNPFVVTTLVFINDIGLEGIKKFKPSKEITAWLKFGTDNLQNTSN